MARDVLVIAADGLLRRSLEFLFESEGLDVSSHAGIAEAVAAIDRPSRCVVVDDSAVGHGSGHWSHLENLAEAIVVLVSHGLELPGGLLVRAVQKPLVGLELVETVRGLFSGEDVTA